jgi:hypothetical protein
LEDAMNATLSMAFLASCLFAAAGRASEIAPYSGHETREIKALSESEIAGLLAGEGMGFALAAELNGYPGPAHVLELARELALSAEQRAETEALFERMAASARELGARLVDAERALDEMFRRRTVAAASLSEALSGIGALQARLRGAHLQAHLEQSRILSEEQIARYAELRGYRDVGHGAHRRPHRHRHRGG